MSHSICIMLLLLLSSSVFAQADVGISVIAVSSLEDDRVFYMDAKIESHLPNYMSEALYSGVPLPLLLQIEVKESKNWWFDRSLVTIEQRYILHYYPLRDSIKLKNLTNGSSTTHANLASALSKIGSIKRFPILDKEHFTVGPDLYARIRLKVDVSSLPKPLRAESLLGGDWRISSAWKEWAMQ